MTEEAKIEEKKETPPVKRIFAEPLGAYRIVDGSKVFSFEFPGAATLIDNYSAVSYLRDEIWKAMEQQKKAEEEKAKEPQEVPVETI